MKKWETKKTSIVLLCGILVMLTLFYFACSYTLAWLFKEGSVTTPSTNPAKVELGSRFNSAKYNLGTAGTRTTTTSGSTITNDSTTPVYLRVYYCIAITDTTNEICTTKHLSEVVINSGFLASDENIKNTYSGYYYYNTTLEVGQSVSLITSIVPTGEGANRPVEIKLTAEMVDAKSGAFSLGYRDPWDNTPAGWFANSYTLTKPASAVYGPKLDLKWENISKIELTAKTTATYDSIFFCTYNSAWIGINNKTNWNFSKLTASASMTAAAFANGSLNTVTFTISAVDSTAKNASYIGLIWDTNWSKEVEFGGIKFYNHDNNLLYNLVPSKSGKFYDKVSKTELLMYTWSGATPTAASNTYNPNKNIQVIDGGFESYAAGTTYTSKSRADGLFSVDITGTLSVDNTTAFEGSQSLKATITGGDITKNTNIIQFNANGLKGKKYRITLAYKSTAKNMDTFNNRTVYIQKTGGTYQAWGRNNQSLYSCSGDWEIITQETTALTDNGTLLLMVYFPANAITYIDAICFQEI